ncbi:MAG TPA: dehydratase, partial [Burkholderiaceae bacterium]|nr:dehydratase [Burkholderiaceae bacterium]
MYWEDFPVGSRREFGGITVTKEAIIAFAREFDPQPFHID